MIDIFSIKEECLEWCIEFGMAAIHAPKAEELLTKSFDSIPEFFNNILG